VYDLYNDDDDDDVGDDGTGVYGDVMRVKILFNKKDTALIQFVDATQAQRGTYVEILTR